MLCRAVLSAIAISCTFLREPLLHVCAQASPLVQIKDVICVLLLSGLQKEDIDANTMEKLRRHININDMNNENLRQDCLLQSLDTAKSSKEYEGKNNTSIITINQEIQSEFNVANTQKSDITVTDNDYLSYFKSLMNGNTTKGFTPKELNLNDNIQPSNIIETKPVEVNITLMNNKNNNYPVIEYIQDQPSLDSVIKFWHRLKITNPTRARVGSTTMYTPPRTEVIPSTKAPDNNGYIHSNEMEYVNRMISEYLARQTEHSTTTTQATTAKFKNFDIITRKINQLLDKKEENQDIMDPVFLSRALAAFGGIPNINKLTQINNNNDNNGAAQQAIQSTPQKVIDYDNNEQLARILAMPYNSVTNNKPKVENRNSAPKTEPLQYLNNILRSNKELTIKSAPISYTEKTTQTAIINNQKQETNNNKVKGFQNDEVINNAKSILRQGPANIKGNDQATVSADDIQKIAEMVKAIVMKDIRKAMPTTEDATTKSTTANPITTTRITSSTVQPVVTYAQMKEGNKMMQEIMALLKEFNSMKETTIAPVRVTVNTENTIIPIQHLDPIYSPIVDRSNFPSPAYIRPIEFNTYQDKFVPIPLEPADGTLQGMQYLPNSNPIKEYRLPSITFQTHSGLIPPLAIQVSKPMPLINQHIIVTTQNPFGRHQQQLHRDNMQDQPPQKSKQLQLHRDNKQLPLPEDTKETYNEKITEVLNVGQERNRPLEKTDLTYADLNKRLRLAQDIKKEFRDYYRLQKLREKMNNAREHNREKARELTQSLGSGRVEISRLLDQPYQELGDLVGSRHYDALNQYLNANNPEVMNRAIDTSRQDGLIPPLYSNQEPYNKPLDLNRQNNLNLPSDRSPYESFNRPSDVNQYDAVNRADGLNQRDIITRDVLSRQVGSNRHDVINRLVQQSRDDIINKPIDLNQQSKTHHSAAYGRIEHERMRPRYKGAKFHEELERVESVPRNNQKATTSCCDLIVARQQVPLNKVKNQRFDDTHFRNFLKSQQKVTDMLEKILAAKYKPKPSSVETPY